MRTDVYLSRGSDGRFYGKPTGLQAWSAASLDGMARAIRDHVTAGGRDGQRVVFKASPQLRSEYEQCFMCGGSGEVPAELAPNSPFLGAIDESPDASGIVPCDECFGLGVEMPRFWKVRR